MSFAPSGSSFDPDEKKWLKYLGASTLITVFITKVGDVAADEFKAWLARRREAKKNASQGTTP